MTDLELIFSMLGEASTTEIVKTQNPKGFIQNQKAAKQGGSVAGNARRELESRTGDYSDESVHPFWSKVYKYLGAGFAWQSNGFLFSFSH